MRKTVVTIIVIIVLAVSAALTRNQLSHSRVHANSHALARSLMDAQRIASTIEAYLNDTNDMRLVAALLSTNRIEGNKAVSAMINMNVSPFEVLAGVIRAESGVIINRLGEPYTIIGQQISRGEGARANFDLKLMVWSCDRTKPSAVCRGVTNFIILKNDAAESQGRFAGARGWSVGRGVPAEPR